MSKFKNVHPLDWTLVAGGKTDEPLYVIKSEGAIARTRQAWFDRGFALMSEEDAENRMNIIGQNGNVGYPEEVVKTKDKCGYFIEDCPEVCSNDKCVCHLTEEKGTCEEFCGDLSCRCTQKVQKEIDIVKNHFEETFPKTPKEVNEKPERYSSREVNGMDVIDLVKHWDLNFNEGNILKYLLRDKGQDVEDLRKIIDYAQRELKHKLK